MATYKKPRPRRVPFHDLQPGDTFLPTFNGAKRMVRPPKPGEYFVRADEMDWPIVVMPRGTLCRHSSNFHDIVQELGVIRVKVKSTVSPC